MINLDDASARADYYRAHGLWTDERLGWVVSDVAAHTPDREFIVIGDDRYTYGEFSRWAEEVGRDLVAAGIKRGDRILIQLPNQVEALVAQAAAFRIGAVNVPVVPIYREHELSYITRDCRPAAIIAVGENRGRIPTAEFDELLAGTDIEPLRYCVGEDAPKGWRQFPAQPAADAEPVTGLPDPLEADKCAIMLYTSGTTSNPKGVQLTSRAFISNARALRTALGFGSDTTFFVCSPLSHLAGFVSGVLWPSSVGSKVVVMPKWNGEEAAAVIEREKVNFTTAAAVFLHDLVAVYREGRYTDHRITYFMSGGAATPPALIREANELGVMAWRGYGMTETGGGVCWGSPHETLEVKAETDGRVIPGTEIQAVDQDRNPLPPGGEGEIRVRSPQSMTGYTVDEVTRAQMDAAGWTYTGDVGTVDASGLVRITGRIKDIINRAGEKFSTREIEELILSHPSVAAVAVVGLPDPRLGEKVGAFVTLAPDAVWTDGSDLEAYLKEQRLTLQKIPTTWTVVEGLPFTASGKVQKHLLVDLVR